MKEVEEVAIIILAYAIAGGMSLVSLKISNIKVAIAWHGFWVLVMATLNLAKEFILK